MNSTIDLNNNASECIQTINNIGNSTYQNICNNTSHIVPWGNGDWIAFFVVGFVIISVIVGVVKFIKVMRDF